jgi:hypothetical protein
LIIGCVAVHAITVDDPIRHTFDATVSRLRIREHYDALVCGTYVHHLTNREPTYPDGVLVVLVSTPKLKNNAITRDPQVSRHCSVSSTNDCSILRHLLKYGTSETSLRQLEVISLTLTVLDL